MTKAVAACGVFLISALAVCDERPGGATETPREENRMTTIRIGQTTIWHGDGYSVGVSYIIEGRYRNAAGEEKTGPVAGLVIVKAGTRGGEGETYVDVGAGSEFRLGDRVCKVLAVVRGGGEGGFVEFEVPR